MRERLRKLGERHQVPMQVTGIGSMWKIHFSPSPVLDYRSTLQGSHLLHTALFLFGLNRGVFLSEGGRCCLSTAIGEAEMETYLGLVEEFLALLTR